MRGDGLLFQRARPNARPIPPTVRFVDVNPDYGINDLPLLTSEQVSVRHQMKNVLSTPLGSEDYEPTYGSMLPYIIMERIGAVNAYRIETDALMALTTWMSNRIVVSVNLFSVVPLADEDGYAVHIPYGSLATGEVDQFDFEVLR